jgi:hypothetical protein
MIESNRKLLFFSGKKRNAVKVNAGKANFIFGQENLKRSRRTFSVFNYNIDVICHQKIMDRSQA